MRGVQATQAQWSRGLGVVFGLLLPLALQQWLYRTSPFAGQIPFDTENTYLPFARRFLEDFPQLFADPQHLIVGPGSFIYMALFGAVNENVVQGNLLFAGVGLILAFDALRRVCGWVAAAGVGWLVALSPLLPEVMIVALSEPPQLLCLGIWLWCCALICESQQRRWPMLLGGVALLLSILTRATYLYWIAAVTGACLLMVWKCQPPLRRIACQMLAVHLIAGAGSVAYITYNKVVFNFPMVATGSGAALYFGVNPAVNGYEPPYFGLLHDHFHALVDVGDHLSITGDRLLGQMAKAELMDMPPEVLTAMLFQKIGATLFFSQAELTRDEGESLLFSEGGLRDARTWRVFLVVLCVVALWHYRRAPYLWMLGGILAYQVAIMSLVMYNKRYAIGAVDFPLTFLAGMGIQAIWEARSRVRVAAVCGAVMLLGIVLGHWHQYYSRPLMPDLSLVANRIIASAQPGDLQWSGMDGNPFATAGARTTAQDAMIVWNRLVFPKLGGIPIVQFHAQSFPAACRSISLDFVRLDGQIKSISMNLNHMKSPQTISIGTLGLDGLEPDSGTLRIRMACPVGSRLELSDLTIHVINRGLYYRDLVMQRPVAAQNK